MTVLIDNRSGAPIYEQIFSQIRDQIFSGALPEDTPLLRYVRDLKNCEITLHNTGSVRILNVENVLREGLKKALEAEGYAVRTARDGEAAVRKFAERVPDVVILDVMMPRMNGFRACEEIRKTDRRVPVVFLTAKDDEVDQVRALGLGADDYVSKSAPEAKSIPLIYEMARQSGAEKYFIARKKAKAYMQNVFEAKVQSITTAGQQSLFLDAADAEMIKGKRILIIDDVISTGESLHATQELVKAAGGIIVGCMAVLAEGDAQNRFDICTLQTLPLFNPDGTIKE